ASHAVTIIQHYLGSSVLSDFRRERLLQRFTALGLPISEVQARYEHYVWLQTELDAEDSARLNQLLEYGEPWRAGDPGKNDLVLRVVPRLGTVSPWASKATDIAHNCGLRGVKRIER